MGAARRTEAALLAVAAFVPAAFAATHVANVADSHRDSGVVRALGLEPGAWRGVDTAVELLLQAVPVGTRAARAALGGAIVAAVTGAVLFSIVRAFLEACAPTRRLGSAVAAITTVLALVGTPWQAESSSLDGAAAGALLVFVPLGLFVARRAEVDEVHGAPRPDIWRAVAFALGLATGSDPLAGASAFAGAVTLVVSDPRLRRDVAATVAREAPMLGLAFVAALAPLGLGVARARGAGYPLARAFAVEVVGARLAGHPAESPSTLLWTQLGVAVLLFAVVGVALAAVVPRARPLAAALVAVAAVGLATGRFLPCGPWRYSSPLLAALAAVSALSGAGMQALVRVVAAARVPMARASAGMVLLLEVVLPVDAADEALGRPSPDGGAVVAWDDAAWGELGPATVVLLSTEAAWSRANAARARGSLRGDVVAVPSLASGYGPIARRVFASDAALLPLWRDMEIAGAPSESSLAQVAAIRPVEMTYEPRWGRVLAGHLVPEGLFDRFEIEPRGASDRRTALAAFAPRRERLDRLVRVDAPIRDEAARLLRARALLVATLDPRDAVGIGAAMADVRSFAPDDPLMNELAVRLAARGSPRLDDLEP
jgi:hypothetical protein